MMNEHSYDTLKKHLTFNDTNNKKYSIASNLEGMYKIFLDKDIDEIAYLNYIVKNKYTILDGEIKVNDQYNNGSIFTKNNFLHNNIGQAIEGEIIINIFDSENYFLYGRKFSRYSWLTWAKNTEYWPQIMANLLGSKH